VREVVWRRLFEHAPDPQLVTAPQGQVLAANAAATRLLDSRECPLLGSRMAALVVEADRSRTRSLLRRLREGHREALESEVSLRTSGGQAMTVAVTLLGLHDEKGHLEAVSWALRLVGQSRSMTGTLQRARQEAIDLRMALDQAAAVLELDRDGRVTEANQRCTRLLGRPLEELVGCSVADLGLGPDLDERLPEIRRQLIRGRAWGGEVRVIQRTDDVRWVNASLVPLLDKDGRLRRVVALLHDVTRRRLAVERLERERGLTRLGAMAAVVAHEVRNPLAAAQGALEVVGPRVPDEGDRTVLADVIERLSQLNRLVNDILLYARPRPLKLEKADLGDIIDHVVAELRDDAGMRNVQIAVQRPPECPLDLDPEGIRAVLLNLLQNGAEALGRRGHIHILVDRDEDWCRLRVRDEGPGIPEELRERVFEPFFTTRHHGSGLGLAIAQNTVDRHGGRLRLEPGPGGGTDAVVELPAGPEASG
jgi:PAS domain S-box-containing protein